MRSFQIKAVAAAALAATGLAACGGSSGKSHTGSSNTSSASGASTSTATKSASAGKATKIAYIGSSLSSFITAQENGMKNAVGSNGSVTYFNANFNPQQITTLCQNAISSGRYNAIVLAVFEPPVGVPCATAAHAAKIPVFALDETVGKDPTDLKPQVPGIDGGVYELPNENAKLVVNLAKQACAGHNPCNIVAEVISASDPITNQAVSDVAKEVPGAKVLARMATEFNPATLTTDVQDELTAHPDINVILGGSDTSALGAVHVLKAKGLSGKVVLTGQGAAKAGIAAIKAGTMFGTTGTWPFKEGQAIAKMAIEKVNGQTIANPNISGFSLSGPQVITKKNVAGVVGEW